MYKLIILLIAIGSLDKLEACTLIPKGKSYFPADFSFGVSTSAYQIEGGWNEDGRGPSIWDDLVHNHPELIMDGSTGDMAANSYHQFDDDLKILNDLKVNHYRFSISWTRVFPNGDVSFRNQAGIDYYHEVIDKLLANGITPLVTMYHFDTPLEIEKKGGFTSSLIIEYFVQYATELFKIFGDKVKNWITFNEPWFMCKRAYGDGTYPPLVNMSGLADYLCVHNILKAHALAYRVYKSRFFAEQKGRVGISISSPYFMITNTSDMDVLERAMQFNIGYLAHPIFSAAGGYPDIMVKSIARNSLEEGRPMSRLPNLEGTWRDIIRGSSDFLGLNYYSSRFLRRQSPHQKRGCSFSYDQDAGYEIYKNVPMSQQTCDPAGLEGLLRWIRKEYNNVPVLVTENGWRDQGEIQDINRANFLKGHLQAVLNAINDGCNVLGYTHWSLIDNFEWLYGYTSKFGLYAVNMTSPSRNRFPKRSAGFYKNVISARSLNGEDFEEQ